MKVRKYEASSMQEALAKIRDDLGKDAVILHTKKFNRGRFLGMFGKEKIEVLAATEVNLPDQNILPEINARFRTLQTEIKEMKHFMHVALNQLQKPDHKPLPKPYDDLYIRLRENEIEEKLARKIIERCLESHENGELPEEKIATQLAKLLGSAKPIALKENKTSLVALIGPTGVGKTTTIAKLASIFALKKEKKVGLITADTYRLAAIDHLRKYAEIIGLPLEVVFSPNEMDNALAALADKDLILMDTAGRSQNNMSQLFELKDFIQAGRPAEVHLVLSANTKYRDLLDVWEKFSPVGATHIVFTKLDETTSFGNIFNMREKVGCPLSYVTTGQDVPEDIEVPEPLKLSRKLIAAHA